MKSKIVKTFFILLASIALFGFSGSAQAAPDGCNDDSAKSVWNCSEWTFNPLQEYTCPYDAIYQSGIQYRAQVIRGDLDVSTWGDNCAVDCPDPTKCGSCECRCAGRNLYCSDIWNQPSGTLVSRTCRVLTDDYRCIPEATITAPTHNSTHNEGSISLRGFGTDSPTGERITGYQWRIRTNANYLANITNQDTYKYTKDASITLSPGIYHIFYAVRNKQGAWSSWRYVRITVQANAPANQRPEATIDSIRDSSNTSTPFETTDTVTFRGHGTDLDGDPITSHAWAIAKEGTSGYNDMASSCWCAFGIGGNCFAWTGAGGRSSVTRSLGPTGLNLSSGRYRVCYTVKDNLVWAGTNSDYADIVINNPPPVPRPTVSLSANPTTISSGDFTRLTWATSNATSCWATGNWSGSKASSGGFEDMTLNTSGFYNFTIQCQNSLGVNSLPSSAFVSVNAVAVNGSCNTSRTVALDCDDSQFANGSGTADSDYCSGGIPTRKPSVPAMGSSESWGCSGQNGGSSTASDACVVTRAPSIASECGSADGEKFKEAPNSSLCASGNYVSTSPSEVSGSWQWECTGQCNSPVTCTAEIDTSANWIEVAP